MDSLLTQLFLDHRVEILKRIATDFKIDESSILSKYAEPDHIKMICTWKTNRGAMCTNPTMCGFSVCQKHHGKPPPKRKRIPMFHNHKVGETPSVPCVLCETFGDQLDTALPELEIM